MEDQDISPLNTTRVTEMGCLGQASGALRIVTPMCGINNSSIYINCNVSLLSNSSKCGVSSGNSTLTRCCEKGGLVIYMLI